MLPESLPSVFYIFVVLAIVFAALAVRDHRAHSGEQTPARTTWIRMAAIFGLVAAGLVVWHGFFV